MSAGYVALRRCTVILSTSGEVFPVRRPFPGLLRGALLWKMDKPLVLIRIQGSLISASADWRSSIRRRALAFSV